MASPMEGFMNWMEKSFMPIATKIGSQKHLVAIRDGFIGIMPVTMAGSFATLFNVFFRDLPNSILGDGNAITTAMANVIAVDALVWDGSLAVLGLVFVFSLGYHLSKAYDVNPLAGGVIATAAFLATLDFGTSISGYALPLAEGADPDQVAKLLTGATVADGGVTIDVASWGFINYNQLSASNLFSGLIFGMISTMIYVKLVIAKITIKMPDNVPPAVSNAFVALIPGCAAIFACAIITQIIVVATGDYPGVLITELIQKPLLSIADSPVAVVLVNFLMQLFWFFGIHGSNVMSPVTEGIYTPMLLDNNTVWNTTGSIEGMKYMWTRGSFDAYTMMGGSGITLGLIIAIFAFSKREDSRTIAKLAAPMGIFNINEPVIFGMPLVLNPLYFIPFLLVPVVTTIVALAFTYSGLIPPVFIQVPWITPVGIYAFLATGGNVLAGAVAVLNLIIAIAIWSPFVILANRQIEEKPATTEA